MRGMPLETHAADSELKISVRVRSDLKYVDLFHFLLGQVAAEVGLPEERRDWIALALREGVNNAVLHGNRKDPTRWVEVEMERTGEDLLIRIWDQGEGLNEASLRDPRVEENLFKPNGRGIFLIRQFVDEVTFLRERAGHFGIQMRVNLNRGK